MRKTLQSAIANAENNHQLDVDRLYVAEATVGKAMVMKRFHARVPAAVRHASKSHSQHLRLVLRERAEAE